MKRYKGMVALDIDGTLTQEKHKVDRNLLDYLHTLYEKKWQVIFVTGRSFSFAEPIISNFSFPYYLVAQNGSSLFSMPDKKLLFSYPLGKEVLSEIIDFAKECQVGLVVEFYQNGEDTVLYDPKSMPEEEKNYIEYRSTFFRGKWVAVHPLLSYPFSNFLVAKVFGNKKSLEEFSQFLKKKPAFQSFFVRDPFRENSHFFYFNSLQASKKSSVLYLQKNFFPETKLVVAGDDFNDLSLLEIADVAIVMQHAPEALKKIADVVIGTDPFDLIAAIEKGIERL